MHIAALLLGAALVALSVTAVVMTRMTLRRSARPGGNTRSLARWSRATAAGAGLVALLLTLPGISTGIDSAFGVVNLHMLLSHMFGIASLVAIRVLLVAWTIPSEARTAALRYRFGVAGAVAAAATAVFAVANNSNLEFINAYADDGGVGAYLMITDAYWALIGASIARDCTPLALDNIRAGHRFRVLGIGQALIAVGGAACAVWGATEGTFVAVTQAADAAWSTGLQDTISQTSAALFALSLFSGFAVCSTPRAVTRR
ncbi:hypothetical protein DR950_18315 [Kitasatospora xanthocidica]|uniref:Uncharacterized protein n=1 Tax=Kitasatospora xanthocidica TaxID=83382 RepID=A0A372ZUA7_9ACTN|nr:hypothetical protein [Kitasatospora xanthocidica]RGD59488.1 hypothetical protein DR950_18315 [Kitasatospora xanthocidica]